MNFIINDNIEFERRYDIDWLRIIATLMIFFFHCARAFVYIDWHIMNRELSVEFTIFIVFMYFSSFITCNFLLSIC